MYDTLGLDWDSQVLFAAQDLQANVCLHTDSFAGRKNMEHKVRNVRVRNRAGVSLLDQGEMQFRYDAGELV